MKSWIERKGKNMIEANEKLDMITNSIEALIMLQDLRTRLKLLQDYIAEVERKEATSALEYPRGYRTECKNVDINAGKVVWLLNLQHDAEADRMFKEAFETWKQKKAAEEGEEDA